MREGGRAKKGRFDELPFESSATLGDNDNDDDMTNKRLISFFILLCFSLSTQASSLQFSTKNLEKRLVAMSTYANELEGKVVGGERRRSDLGGDAIGTPGPGQSSRDRDPGSPGIMAWKQHTEALQKLFEADQSLK